MEVRQVAQLNVLYSGVSAQGKPQVNSNKPATQSPSNVTQQISLDIQREIRENPKAGMIQIEADVISRYSVPMDAVIRALLNFVSQLRNDPAQGFLAQTGNSRTSN